MPATRLPPISSTHAQAALRLAPSPPTPGCTHHPPPMPRNQRNSVSPPGIPTRTAPKQLRLPRPSLSPPRPLAPAPTLSTYPLQPPLPFTKLLARHTWKLLLPAPPPRVPPPPLLPPDVPTQRPNVPSLRPNVPTHPRNVPTQRPNLPTHRPNLPTHRPNVPTHHISLADGLKHASVSVCHPFEYNRANASKNP